MKIIADVGRNAELLGQIIQDIHRIQTALYMAAELDEVTLTKEFLLYHLEEQDTGSVIITIHIGMEGTASEHMGGRFYVRNQLFFADPAYQFRYIFLNDDYVDLIANERVTGQKLVENMVRRFKELIPYHAEAVRMGQWKPA